MQVWKKELIAAGAGVKPRKGQTVTVNCTGVVESNGHTFWSTTWPKEKGGGPFSFQIGMGQVSSFSGLSSLVHQLCLHFVVVL